MYDSKVTRRHPREPSGVSGLRASGVLALLSNLKFKWDPKVTRQHLWEPSGVSGLRASGVPTLLSNLKLKWDPKRGVIPK